MLVAVRNLRSKCGSLTTKARETESRTRENASTHAQFNEEAKRLEAWLQKNETTLDQCDDTVGEKEQIQERLDTVLVGIERKKERKRERKKVRKKESEKERK